MVNYPYTLKPSTLEDFLKNMMPRPEPKAVTQPYLKGLGYTSSNDWVIIPILKFINFLDPKGSPTDLFRNFRDTEKSKVIMAQVLKESYADLFESFPNPCESPDQSLENFFRTATGRGGRTLAATVDVFKVLCKFADFGAPPVTIKPVPTPTPVPAPSPIVQLPITKEGGISLTVNIRLELPATQDVNVYDKIFESLKKHLLSSSSKTA
ncbi:MAG: DUF5343 domain-containing protein [archaeon]|nr:DUF5343 domain-containing protein [archaeon]